ncbi:protoglobin domain-containing protein [Roseibium sp. SCPC15]|uniref:protoglobin domain-containing protein n=1 Tax=Roseibium sp. SCP15 TaxID=3141376 RepID=UPI00333B82E0
MDMFGTEVLGDYVEHMEVREQDLVNVREVWRILSPNMRSILGEFYKTQYLVQAHSQFRNFNVERLIEKQFAYWNNLFSGAIDSAYRDQVRNIGMTHRKYNISMGQYILAYGWLLNRFEESVRKYTRCAERTLDLMSSVRRLVFIDMALAADAYYVVFVD